MWRAAPTTSTLFGPTGPPSHRWAFQPQTLHDVSAPDLSVELFGRRTDGPLGCAPTGLHADDQPRRGAGVAKRVRRRGLPYGLSTVGSTSIEDLAATGHPRLWFQLYALKDRGLPGPWWSGPQRRLRSPGTIGRHPRGRQPGPGRAQRPDHPASAEGADRLDIGRHLGYWTTMLRSPMLRFPNVVAQGQPAAGSAHGRSPSPGEAVAGHEDMFGPFRSFDWDDLDSLRGNGGTGRC